MRTAEVLSRATIFDKFRNIAFLEKAEQRLQDSIISEIREKLDLLPEKDKVDTMGLISNGNRTWADANNLSHSEGHIRGTEKIIKFGLFFIRLGVNIMPWGFSTENWKRDEIERENLFIIMNAGINALLPRVKEENGRIIHMGRKSEPLIHPFTGQILIPATPDFLAETLIKAEEETRMNTGPIIALAINHSGKDELTRIVEKFEAAKAKEEIPPDTPFIPEAYRPFTDDRGLLGRCNLILRTGGKNTTSDFGGPRFSYAYNVVTPTQLPNTMPFTIRDAFIEYAAQNHTRGA